jgi:hypothetical protein
MHRSQDITFVIYGDPKMLKAFHNDEAIKLKYLNRVKQHAELDEITKGKYWENGKGCAVGCTIHSGKHNRYETELGIPEWLAHLEDKIFEGLPEVRAKLWPEEFLSNINLGSDLEKTKTPFLILVLERNLVSLDACVFDAEKFPDVAKAIEGSRAAVVEVIRCHKAGLSLESEAARSAWSEAEAESAWSAAEAERSARSAESAAETEAEAARSAWSAAEAAAEAAESAWSAESAAWSAWSAESAAWSARSAESAESAESAWSAAARSAAEAAWSVAEAAEAAEAAQSETSSATPSAARPCRLMESG